MVNGLHGVRSDHVAKVVEGGNNTEAEHAIIRHRPVVGTAAPVHHTNGTRVTLRPAKVK